MSSLGDDGLPSPTPSTKPSRQQQSRRGSQNDGPDNDTTTSTKYSLNLDALRGPPDSFVLERPTSPGDGDIPEDAGARKVDQLMSDDIGGPKDFTLNMSAYLKGMREWEQTHPGSSHEAFPNLR